MKPSDNSADVDAIKKALQSIADKGGLFRDKLPYKGVLDILDRPTWTYEKQVGVLYALIKKGLALLHIGRREIATAAALGVPSEKERNPAYLAIASNWTATDGLHDRIDEFVNVWNKDHPQHGIYTDQRGEKHPGRRPWMAGKVDLARWLATEIEGLKSSDSWPQPVPTFLSLEPSAAATEQFRPSVATVRQAAQIVLRDRAGFPFEVDTPQHHLTSNHWRSVLDGSPLTSTHARHGAIVPRTVRFNNQEYDLPGFLESLPEEAGSTLIIDGDTGDGKSAYVSSLVGACEDDSILFVRWADFARDYNHQITTTFRQAVDQLLGSDEPWTLVIVYTIEPPTRQLLDSLLYTGLSARRYHDDGSVVIVDGQTADYAKFRPYIGPKRIEILPLRPEDAIEWVRILRLAMKALVDAGTTEGQIDKAYPHLRAFLAKPSKAQEMVLLNNKEPLLVRLIRAVYGQAMRGKVSLELLSLDSADKHAYLHVCLASMAGRGIPDRYMEELASGAELLQRAEHDPWITDESGRHVARHYTIAQLVLEELDVVSPNTGRLHISRLIRDYASRLGGAYFADALINIVLSVGALELVGREGNFKKMKQHLLASLRGEIGEVKDLRGLLVKAAGDYVTLIRFAGALERLGHVAGNKREKWLNDREDALMWAGHTEALTKAALVTSKQPPDAGRFELLRIEHKKRSLAEELTYSQSRSTATALLRYIGEPWCRRYHFATMFEVCEDTLDLLPKSELTAPETANAIQLYRWLFDSYHRLRKLCPGYETDRKNDYNAKLGTLLFSQLPERAVELVEESLHLAADQGIPDLGTACFFTEVVIDDTGAPADTRKRRRKVAVEMLTKCVESVPAATQALLYLAILSMYPGQKIGFDLQAAIADVPELTTGEPSGGYILHARAFFESDKSKKAGLLTRALDIYRTRMKPEVEAVHRGRQLVWDTACSDLARISSTLSAPYQRFYKKLSD